MATKGLGQLEMCTELKYPHSARRGWGTKEEKVTEDFVQGRGR